MVAIISLNSPVTSREVVEVRQQKSTEESLQMWSRCLEQSMCYVAARDETGGKLLGIGFLAGNPRHAEIVDLSVHPSARRNGIGGAIVDALVEYARTQKIPYFGLTFDKANPWLKGFYERHGFRSIDFAMWEVNCLKAMGE